MESKTQTVRARISPAVKKKAERVLLKIGISPSEAINVFYKRIALEKAFPFSLHVPNAETRRAIADIHAGKGKNVTLGEFIRETRAIAKRGRIKYAKRHIRAFL